MVYTAFVRCVLPTPVTRMTVELLVHCSVVLTASMSSLGGTLTLKSIALFLGMLLMVVVRYRLGSTVHVAVALLYTLSVL